MTSLFEEQGKGLVAGEERGGMSKEHGGQRGDGQPLEGLGKRRGRVRITDMFNVS